MEARLGGIDTALIANSLRPNKRACWAAHCKAARLDGDKSSPARMLLISGVIETDSPESPLPRLSEHAQLTVPGQDQPALGGHMPLGHYRQRSVDDVSDAHNVDQYGENQ
jgi:hypothetical protein